MERLEGWLIACWDCFPTQHSHVPMQGAVPGAHAGGTTGGDMAACAECAAAVWQ